MSYPSSPSSSPSKNALPSRPNRMNKETILIVDDEEDILELIELSPAHEGYDVLTATTGEEALQLAQTHHPELAILDLMLPGIDGLEVCKLLKRDPGTEQMHVIILTAKSDDSDIVTGLELGADDYMTKPFSSKVLVARVRRVLRKEVERDLGRSALRIHDMTIDPARCEVLVEDKPVTLTFSEFNILYALAKRPGFVFTRYQIMEAVHGGDHIVTERAIDVQITYLRKKLGPGKDYIETIRGVGYRLKDRLTN
jgi:two-component system, OmpR family, alkaline phosphatase synthesis response regulator PhoP